MYFINSKIPLVSIFTISNIKNIFKFFVDWENHIILYNKRKRTCVKVVVNATTTRNICTRKDIVHVFSRSRANLQVRNKILIFSYISFFKQIYFVFTIRQRYAFTLKLVDVYAQVTQSFCDIYHCDIYSDEYFLLFPLLYYIHEINIRNEIYKYLYYIDV